MASDYKYGFDAEKVTSLKTKIENLYEELHSYITQNMPKVTEAVAEVWTGEDREKFTMSFAEDINNLYTEVLKLRDEVSSNITNIQTSWEQTQTDNASTMSTLGRY